MPLEAPKSPEQGPMKLNEILSDDTRKKVDQELQTNERLVKLMYALETGRLPFPYEMKQLDRSALLERLVDQRQPTLYPRDRLLELKLDMVDFIEKNIAVRGDAEAIRTKQRQYKQSMEGLFTSLGFMQPQEEYGLITARLGHARLLTPESQARYGLMRRRKQELEQEYGAGPKR